MQRKNIHETLDNTCKFLSLTIRKRSFYSKYACDEKQRSEKCARNIFLKENSANFDHIVKSRKNHENCQQYKFEQPSPL